MAAIPRPFTLLGTGSGGTPTFNGLTSTGTVVLTSAATSGLQIYNTADQTTNYERVSGFWTGNIFNFGTYFGGSATARKIRFGGSNSAGSSGLQRYLEIDPNIRPFATIETGTSLTGTAILYSGTQTQTSGTNVLLALTPNYNQASGTAANTDLLINRTETAVGSGTQYLIQAQVGGANRFVVDRLGHLAVGTGQDTSTLSMLRFGGNFSGAANTVNGAAIRVDSFTYTDTSTAVSGTSATSVFSSFAQPTLAATNALVTTTDAATVYIANAPVAGTNMTLTRSHALWIDAGSFRLDGTSGAGVAAGTLANAPSAGDPDKWIPINSDGTQYWFPAWAA